MDRFELIVALFVLLCLASGNYTLADNDSPAKATEAQYGTPSDAADDEQQSHRQREGTRLSNQQGYFRGSGDGLTFHLRNSEEKYAALENLALERIGKVMSDRHDHPDQLNWNVSGFFTEYRGGNYLFITHAVLESKNRGRSALP